MGRNGVPRCSDTMCAAGIPHTAQRSPRSVMSIECSARVRSTMRFSVNEPPRGEVKPSRRPARRAGRAARAADDRSGRGEPGRSVWAASGRGRGQGCRRGDHTDHHPGTAGLRSRLPVIAWSLPCLRGGGMSAGMSGWTIAQRLRSHEHRTRTLHDRSARKRTGCDIAGSSDSGRLPGGTACAGPSRPGERRAGLRYVGRRNAPNGLALECLAHPGASKGMGRLVDQPARTHEGANREICCGPLRARPTRSRYRGSRYAPATPSWPTS